MRIHITLTTGNPITLDVEAYTTVHNLKMIIQNKVGIPRKQQRLIFKNKQLEDMATLSSYDVVDGAN